MLSWKALTLLLMGTLALGPLAGCENVDANKKAQGAVIGGAGGALAGALIGGHNRWVGGLVGGALGAGGGYLIGSQLDKNDERHREEAFRASDYDRDHPPSVEDARRAPTADLNGDGYVTLNEVVAMRKAGLSDDEMIGKLERTGQVFTLGPEQEGYLRDRGVSDQVISAMQRMNQDRARPAGGRNDDRYQDYDRARDRNY